MASGDTLLILGPLQSVPPATAYATLDTIAGGSTPAEAFPVLDFDDTTQEYTDFPDLVMPQNYSGGGVTAIIGFSSGSTSTNATLGLAFRRIADDAEVITGSHSYDFNTVTDASASAAGEVAYASITFTDGVDMDSVVAGDLFNLRATRDPGDATSGDVSIHFIHLKET